MESYPLQTRSGPAKWVGLIVIIAICLGAASLGAAATLPEIPGWYQTINKPLWNPPNSVFGPVWTTLYILMAVAAWLVWSKVSAAKAKLPLLLFAIQLLLNMAWSWIFFHFHQLGWAFAEIIALWVAIVLTTIAFYRVVRPAGWLMVPYLAWVSFASLLNFTIWQMN